MMMGKEFEKRWKSMKGTDGKDMNVPSKMTEKIKKSEEILRHYVQGATDAYVTHLTFGGKADQEQEDYIIALDDGANALAYIQQLVAQVEKLKRERDAAVEELKGYGCTYCKRIEDPDESMCGEKCADFCNWEWRGVKEE